MIKKILIFCFSLLLSFWVFAQDTLTVMHYNLLNYGVITDYCNNTNNSIDEKESHLRTILGYELPDIFTVNEISPSGIIHDRLLNNVLNADGRAYFRKSSFLSVADSRIVNMLYYNSAKLSFHSHVIAQSYIRDIDIYTLYCNSSDLVNGDTIFIHCIVAHLKAGDGVSNVNARRIMANNTMDYLDLNRMPGNYLFMGDFNIDEDAEPAYVSMLYYANPAWRFIDPIDRPGYWSNNSNYSDVHTQSTKSESNGCAAPGGMDDRFDFILVSDDIQKGNRKVKYLTGSYLAIGQDGQHFNRSIISSPTNVSVPSNVLYALFYNSDHLPVSMKIVVDKQMDVHESRHIDPSYIKMNNPAGDDLTINLNCKKSTQLQLAIMNMSGQAVLTRQFDLHHGANTISMDMAKLEDGFYLVSFTDNKGFRIVKKLIKN